MTETVTPVTAGDSHSAPSSVRLWAEFAALYLGIPLLLAFALSPRLLYPILLGMTGVGLILLYRTPGWRSRRFLTGWSWKDIGILLADNTERAEKFIAESVPEKFRALDLRLDEQGVQVTRTSSE